MTPQSIQAWCHHEDGTEHPSDGSLPCRLTKSAPRITARKPRAIRRPRLTRLPFHPRGRRHLTVRVQFATGGSYLSVETGRGQWTVSC